jgi:hypothetical protein
MSMILIKVIDILKINMSNMYFVVQDLKVLVLSEVLDFTGILYTHTHIHIHIHFPKHVLHLELSYNIVN